MKCVEQNTFKMYDRDNSSSLSTLELRAALNAGINKHKLKPCFKKKISASVILDSFKYVDLL